MALGTIIRAKNNGSTTLTAGKVVYVSGFSNTASEAVSIVSLANYVSENTMPAIGIVSADIEPLAFGTIRVSGSIGGFDTSIANIGDPVFVGSNGSIIFQDPTDDPHNDYISQQLGVVSKVGMTDGQIIIFPLEIKEKIRHTQLSEVLPDQHHNEIHAAKHGKGQNDELNHNILAGLSKDDHPQYVLADGSRPITGDTSINAGLTITSLTKAFIPPRMNTTQRDALSVAAGMFIYNTTTNKLNFYNGSAWREVSDIAG